MTTYDLWLCVRGALGFSKYSCWDWYTLFYERCDRLEPKDYAADVRWFSRQHAIVAWQVGYWPICPHAINPILWTRRMLTRIIKWIQKRLLADLSEK